MPTHILAREFASAWESVVAPWLTTSADILRNGRAPALLIVPSISFAIGIRARLARTGFAVAGVHIWTPVELRHHFQRRLMLGRGLTEAEMNLVVTAAAEEVSRVKDSPVTSILRQNGAALREDITSLSAGGWGSDELRTDELRSIGAAFERLCRLSGMSLPSQVDFTIAQKCGEPNRDFSRVLVIGFGASQWACWPLLTAVARCTSDLTVVNRAPNDDPDGLEECWITSWECLAGPFDHLPDVPEDTVSLAPLADALARQETVNVSLGGLSEKFTLHVGIDQTAQACAAVQQAKLWLAERGDCRLALVVPANGALAREVASRLEAESLLFWNDLGTPAPGLLARHEWEAFVDFLAEPTAPKLKRLLGAGVQPSGLSAAGRDRMCRILEEGSITAFSDSLAHVCDVLPSDSHGCGQVEEAISFLRSIPHLPERGQFRELHECFLRSLAIWSRHDETGSWTIVPKGIASLEVNRAAFLAWVRDTVKTDVKTGEVASDHPYARLVLTTCTRASGQDWTHVALLGMNDGIFPEPVSERAFLGDETVKELNARARGLQAGEQTKNQSGEVGIKPGHTLLVGASTERCLRIQSVTSILSTARKCAVLLSLHDETVPGSKLRPSEYAVRLFRAVRGTDLTEEHLEAVAACYRAPQARLAPIEQVRHAYAARRDRTTAFDEFSFSYRTDEPRRIRLGGGSWEAALSYPAQCWMKGALRLQLPREEADLPWGQALGVWAHTWLQAAAGPKQGVVTFRDKQHFRSSVRKAADKHIDSARARFKGGIPEWWQAVFDGALLAAMQLAASLDQVDPVAWPAFAMEYSLPRGTSARFGDASLSAEGRLDLVFLSKTGATVAEILSGGAQAWVLDFKTGAKDKLSARRLAKGDGLQLALYGLALESAGASEVILTILKPGAAPEGQLTLADLKMCGDLWGWLLSVQSSGRLGQRELTRSAFTAGPRLPLATLPIAQDILDAKWTLTHAFG